MKRNTNRSEPVVTGLMLVLLLMLSLEFSNACAQGTAFTYQGRLGDGDSPANGTYDFRFRLASDMLGNHYVGNPDLTNGISVSNGLFTVSMDFGPGIFDSSNYWLEVDVRTNGGSAYTTLNPLQKLTPAPYSIFAGQASGLIGLTVEQNTNGAPNLIGGSSANYIADGAVGATVAGGGATNDLGFSYTNSVLNSYGTVSGGGQNSATGIAATVGGGAFNIASGDYSTVGGSAYNTASGASATVAGGASNTAGGNGATVAGGAYNIATGGESVVAGGISNSVSGMAATISGGASNTASGPGAFIGGGGYDGTTYLGNLATGIASVVVGGLGNSAIYDYAVVGGGHQNHAEGIDSTVGGGIKNTAGGFGAFVGGGDLNAATNNYAVIGGGFLNNVGGLWAAVGGGYNNNAWGDGAFIGGGGTDGNTLAGNMASGEATTIGGGLGNVASGYIATVAGGWTNNANGGSSTVSGGCGNNADSIFDTVGGGYANTANGGSSTVGGGYLNSASGGDGTVPGGYENVASGYRSFAAGSQAYATNLGAFVWADSQGSIFSSTTDNTFNIRAQNGVRLNTDTSIYFGAKTRQMLNLYDSRYGIGVQTDTTYFRTSGGFAWFQGGQHSDTQNDPGAGGTVLMTLTSGGLTVNGTFVSTSDRNAKENFQPVSPRSVLDKVAALHVSEWDYKSDTQHSRHIGPMAQDFYAAFGIGPDNKHITVVDEGGVALAAIQGLNQKVDTRDQSLESQIQQKNVEIRKLKEAVNALKKVVSQLAATKGD